MSLESDNIFGVVSKGENIAIMKMTVKHGTIPTMSNESAATLAAWLLVCSAVAAADFEQLVAAVRVEDS